MTRARHPVRHPDSERPTVEIDPHLLRNKLRDIVMAEGTPVSGIPVIPDVRPTMPTTDLDPTVLRGLLVEETAVLDEAPVSRASFGLIEVEVVPPDHEDEAPPLPEVPNVQLSKSVVAQLPIDANAHANDERPAYWRESFKPEPRLERDAMRTQQVTPLPVEAAVMAYLRAPSGTAIASAQKPAWQLPAITGIGGVLLGILSTIALYSL